MENIIISRAVLAFVCVVNIFVGYAAGAVHCAINRKAWKAWIIIEVTLITAFILYDNIFVDCHPQDGWVLASLGYLFVYFMAFLAWFMYSLNTKLKKNKVYTMNKCDLETLLDKKYIGGNIDVDGKKIEVLLPFCQEDYEAFPEQVAVQFDYVMYSYIFVKQV